MYHKGMLYQKSHAIPKEHVISKSLYVSQPVPYPGRPVIVTSRIDNHDGGFVTFHYNRHEDDACMEETLPVMEFTERLIRHIPEKHFKMIRYGGIHAAGRLIKNPAEPFPVKGTTFLEALTSGALPYSLLLVMTH